MVHIVSSLVSVAALASAAAITPQASNNFVGPSGKGNFQLLALTNDGYAGTFLTLWHSGAGTNVAVLSQNQTTSPAFNFDKKTGDVFVNAGVKGDQFPESLGLTNFTDYMGNTPSNYYVVTVDVGKPKQGLSFSPEDRNTMDGPVGGKFESFVSCLSNASVFYGQLQPQLFWRPMGSKVADGCRDVDLKAIFNH